MSRVIHIDGDWTKPSATGLIIGEAPFSNLGDNNEYVFRQPFVQLRSYFKRQPIGTKGPASILGARLVEETTPRDIGGGAIEWDRVWALVPPRQVEVGDTVHIYTEQIGDITILDPSPTRAIYYHDFFYAPGDTFRQIGLYRAEKLTTAGGTTVLITESAETMNGSLPFGSSMKTLPLDSNYKVSVDSSLERWMGPIWKRTTPVVRQIRLADFVT